MMQSVVADGALSAAVKRALLASLAGSPPDPADRPLTALAGFVAAASADPAGLSRSDYELLYAEGWSEPQVMEALHLSAFAPYMSTMNAALGG
jgi:alkylhydroperoxidase family enzyme